METSGFTFATLEEEQKMLLFFKAAHIIGLSEKNSPAIYKLSQNAPA
jgi:hypothetical protein